MGRNQLCLLCSETRCQIRRQHQNKVHSLTHVAVSQPGRRASSLSAQTAIIQPHKRCVISGCCGASPRHCVLPLLRLHNPSLYFPALSELAVQAQSSRQPSPLSGYFLCLLLLLFSETRSLLQSRGQRSHYRSRWERSSLNFSECLCKCIVSSTLASESSEK